MRRRELIAGLGAAVALPLAAAAQQQTQPVRRIGVLLNLNETDPEGRLRALAFRQGLEQLGWIEDRNIQIDYRWTSDDPQLAHTYADELLALKPDVIFASPTFVVAILREKTRSVPIVFAQIGDPVGLGFVASLARPGGNVTGFGNFEDTLSAKWLELLKQIVPSMIRVAVIYDPVNSGSFVLTPIIEAAARAHDVQVFPTAVRDVAEIEHTLNTFGREPNGGLIPLPGPLLVKHRERVISIAMQHRLPNVYAYRYYPVSGGLASYGVDNIDPYRRAASYVDRILKGEKPGDLPVQMPTKFELVINLKTAKALGLTIPETLLATADEVIQ
jgi:putative tryptophan/tyrosine transport system substrate-binding protein